MLTLYNFWARIKIVVVVVVVVMQITREGRSPAVVYVQMTIQEINSFNNIFLKGQDLCQQGNYYRPCGKITIKFCDFSVT